ncbi:MAG TPA: hypothetical protein VFW66_08635 [Gemmatimonadales bacterium]|nr:hypothetical protein [Gemmatimonadales bacterium]
MRIAALVGSALLLAGATGSLAAQEHRWGISTDFGITRFWGAARDVSTSDGAVSHPYRPTTFALRLDRSFGRVVAAFGVQYAQSGLAVEASDLSVVGKGAFKWVQLAPEAAYRLTMLGGNSLYVFGGPVLDIWNPGNGEGRTRAGGRAGLELRVPFGRSIAGLVRAAGAVTGSVFEDGELPAGFESTTMSRAGVSLGFRVGL